MTDAVPAHGIVWHGSRAVCSRGSKAHRWGRTSLVSTSGTAAEHSGAKPVIHLSQLIALRGYLVIGALLLVVKAVELSRG
jgi:hypothetical protein